MLCSVAKGTAIRSCASVSSIRPDLAGQFSPLGARMLTEDRLSDVLSEFARTLVTDFPIEGILDHLVVRIVDILPIEGAGVSLISPTIHPQFIAASDQAAMK